MTQLFVRLARRVGEKRLVALALAPGFLLLGLDAAIGHLAGKEGEPPQIVPVVLSPLSFLLVLVAGLPFVREGAQRLLLRITGVVNVVLGLFGTGLHLKELGRHFDGGFSFSALEDALSVAPPAFAPLAFTGMGALLWIVASPALRLRVTTAPEPGGAAAPEANVGVG
jgi:hypothetical protein